MKDKTYVTIIILLILVITYGLNSWWVDTYDEGVPAGSNNHPNTIFTIMIVSGIIYILSFLLLMYGNPTSISIAALGFFVAMIINIVAAMINLQSSYPDKTTFEVSQSKISSVVGALVSAIPIILIVSMGSSSDSSAKKINLSNNIL